MLFLLFWRGLILTAFYELIFDLRLANVVGFQKENFFGNRFVYTMLLEKRS
jgi:hypothetical protein